MIIRITAGAAALVLGACAGAPAIDLERWPTTSGGVALDAAMEERITALLASMTLEEKVGQMVQADTLSITPEELGRHHLGSVLSGGGSGPDQRAFASGAEWLALNDAFYEASIASGAEVPAIIGIDAVHGLTKVIGATIVPHNVGLGATRNPELIRKLAEITALEMRVAGFDWDFSPTLAVVRDDRWGRTYEGFSEDPQLVQEYAGEAVLGLQGDLRSGPLAATRVIATAKHFLGDGGTFEGRDQGDNRSSERELIAIHAPGYVAAIDAGVQAVMLSFSSWQGGKMHGRHDLVTSVLKGRMGFGGFVVGDWNGHGQVHGCHNRSCPQAINAGLDMFMAPFTWKELLVATIEQARAGVIPEIRIADAVRRILRVKLRAGLFERGRPSSREPAGRFELLGAPEHRALARQAARESLVLLKNQGGLLPLAPKQRVLIAGDADNIARQCGGWTLTWQGSLEHGNEMFPGGTSIQAGIEAAVESAGGEVIIGSDPGSAKVDVAIVVFGEEPYAEFEGDRIDVDFDAEPPILPLLQSLQAAGVPVVSVFLSGRPLYITPELEASDAFVAAWLPGSEGGAVADVLFGGHDFKGKLSYSWPRTAQDSPNHGDPRFEPLFPYGFGLSYR